MTTKPGTCSIAAMVVLVLLGIAMQVTLSHAVNACDPGVCSCSGSTVDCANKALTAVPSAIPATTTVLWLHQNQITSIAADSFTGLTVLTSLTLTLNQISTISASAFTGLSALTWLILSSNQISDVEVFRQLTALNRIDLDRNNITRLSANAFSGLGALTRLALGSNQLTSISAGTFAGLTALSTLDLSNQKITSLAPEAFAGLPALNSLLLNSNSIVSIPAKAFTGLASLSQLRLDHNQIINIPADAFAELTTVSTLSLNDNPITTLPPGLFKGLQNDPDLYWSSVDGNSPVLAPNNFTFGGNTAAPPSMYGTATAPYKCDKVCATCFDVGSGSCCGANCLQCTVGNRCTVCYDGYDMKSGYCLASAATNSSLALIASVASSASAVFAASASSASVASRASATSAISASAASVASTKSASVASLASATSAISASVASASAASASSAWQTSAASVASSSPQGDSAASSPVAAIAAAVASVVGVGLIALAVFLVRRRRSQRPVKDSSEPVYHDTVEMNNSLLAKSASKDSDAHYTVLQANPIHQNPEGASYELPQKSPEREGTEGDSHYAAPVARPERQNAEGALRYEMPEKSPNHEDLQGPAQYAVPETNPDRPSSANTSRYEMPERTSPEGVSRYEMPERQGTEGASRYEMPEKPPTGGQNKEAHVHYEEMQNAHVRENKADIPSYEVPEKSTSEPLYHAVSSTSPDDIYDNENVYMTGSNSHRIREGLAIVKHLASGNFGDVSLGEVPFAVLPPRAQSLLGSTSSERVQVAVKSLKSNADEKSRKDFESEARLMAPFVHPNVVHLLAALVESEPHLVLIEFVRYGDLRSLLETSKNKSLWWSENEQVHAIRQIALGMEYLGTLHFVHRDLAARNCLVGQNMVVKIADFGLSRELADESDYYRMQTRGKVPAKWMAPEALTQRKFSSMSDVWSFGVTAWECCSYGDKPYGKIEARDILAHVEAGGRLPMPENCSLGFYHLMLSCWNMTPTLRPSFSQLVASLAAFQDGTAIRDIGALL